MDVDLDIEHTDLDGDEDEPSTALYVSIVTADGMRYSGSLGRDGDNPDPDVLADMMVRATLGAAHAHSPALGAALARRLT